MVGALGAPVERVYGEPPISAGMGFDRVGAQLPAGSEPTWDFSESGVSDGTLERFSWSPASEFVGWSDLRLEAWRGEPTGDGGIAPDAVAPLEAAVPRDLDGTLTASFPLQGWPGVSHYWVVLTGLDVSGQRFILVNPYSGWTTFHGSVADWVTALVAPAR